VATGLWLGTSPDRAAADRFVVSPRGAAQRVYKGEVRRRVDPALLEQVGPRQYRLRAFPIPARDPVAADHEQPRLYLWLSYRALAHDGHWPLPCLLEKRNVYWDRSTKRVYDGEAWLPESVPARHAPGPRGQLVTLVDGTLVLAEPVRGSGAPLDGGRYAVVVDRSRSMERRASELERALAQLARHHRRDRIDLFLGAAASSGERMIERQAWPPPRDLEYYGGQSLRELLEQFESARGDRAYDAVLVLTDDGSYELARDGTLRRRGPDPLWLVHLGGALPPAYDDDTLQAVRKSRGGIAVSVTDALQQIAARSKDATVAAGYRFSPVAPHRARPTTDDGFAAIAAGQEIRRRSAHLDGEPAGLDAIHALARQTGIVTEYSSMIVLVNDRQREALAAAERDADRFHRTVEAGKEQLTAPGQLVSGVPEPAEWALIALAALALVVLSRRTSAWRGGLGNCPRLPS
jgi:putative PEP-CTERM system integral membrane protein